MMRSAWTYTERLQGECKRKEAIETGPSLGLYNAAGPTKMSKTVPPPGLFGKPTECKVLLHGNHVKVLLDSGSTVFTVSRVFFFNII